MATAAARRAAPPSPAWTLAGVHALLLGLPLAVLASPTGPYDDPKAWALPLLVALTVLAWIASARPQTGVSPPPDRRTRVVVGIVLAGLAWSLITTIASVAPAQSVFGTFGRGVGMLTLGLAALLFFVARSECRTPGDVRSLIDVALLGSVPVCALAVAQAVGWDPLPKAWDPAVRTLTVRSTFGTHVFLGSYLVVLVPFTVARLEWAVRQRVESGRWPSPPAGRLWRIATATAWVLGVLALVGLGAHWPLAWWALAPWGVAGALAWRLVPGTVSVASDTVLSALLLSALLAGQVLVVILSRGRGAFIGMLTGIGVTACALLLRRRAWKTLAAAALGAAAIVLFLVLLNVPGSPIAPLAKVRLLSRLGEITNVEPRSPVWVRVRLWRGISEGWRRQIRGEEIIPGVSPRLRSFIGYGPETQIVVLEPLTTSFARQLSASGEGWQARYVFDRAHSALLDRLITEGLVGAVLWLALLGSLVVVGVGRLRAGVGAGDTAIRVGALGAILGHVADSQVGMATPMTLVVFWLAAAVLTSDRWTATPAVTGAVGAARAPERPGRWTAAFVVGVLAASLVAFATTRWLLASMAYADGVRLGIAGQLSDAYREFRRSVTLAPWLPLPAESAAYTALRLATAETVPSRRVALLHEAEALLRQARGHAIGGPGSWALSAQVAFAEARGGEPSQLATSREAFAIALRLRPDDPRLLAQSAWVWLESGDALKARRMAEQALAHEPREWLAWAVLARVSKALADGPRAAEATARARELAPVEARPLLDALLR